MDRQRQVLGCFKGDKSLQLTKQQIIEISGICYYHNTNKHVGDILSRMVKNGSLKRIKKGVYSLGSGNKKQIIIDINQIELFNH